MDERKHAIGTGLALVVTILGLAFALGYALGTHQEEARWLEAYAEEGR